MSLKVRIEDEIEDVLGKAMRGLGMTPSALAEKARVHEDCVTNALEGRVDVEALGGLAHALSLDFGSLCELCSPCEGPAIQLPDGLLMVNTAHPVPGYTEMTVNSYLLISGSEPSSAIAFDAGSEPAVHRRILSDQGRELRQLFLTHTHRDHIAGYEALKHPGLESYTPAREPFNDAKLVESGMHFEWKEFSIKACETSGHSPGGTSYRIDGLGQPVAIVGDALFCRSIGKIPPELYKEGLRQIEERILTLPDDTILCPGHGPVSTVAFEKAHNPFFARKF